MEPPQFMCGRSARQFHSDSSQTTEPGRYAGTGFHIPPCHLSIGTGRCLAGCLEFFILAGLVTPRLHSQGGVAGPMSTIRRAVELDMSHAIYLSCISWKAQIAPSVQRAMSSLNDSAGHSLVPSSIICGFGPDWVSSGPADSSGYTLRLPNETNQAAACFSLQCGQAFSRCDVLHASTQRPAYFHARSIGGRTQ